MRQQARQPSDRARALVRGADFVDLHADIEVPVRVFGYRPEVRHPAPRRVRPLVGHLDFPRCAAAGLTAVVYDIATNPFRPAWNRLSTTLANIEGARSRIGLLPELQGLALCHADYVRLRAEGRVAYFLAIQGGNAFSADLSVLEGELGEQLHRITLVHLTSSDIGGTSSPAGPDRGLTSKGAALIEVMNAQRIVVDLAHAGKRTFWEALDVQAVGVPPIVSHTGVTAVRRHWRNLDDDQIRTIADRGGVIGIMYQSSFLEPVRYSCSRRAIVDHLEHLIAVGGEQVAAIGTDYDGFIVPPRDLLDVTDHPLLVQDMLDRGWTDARIRRVLGENALRVMAEVRP